jgi:hypothetical protein
LVVVKVFGGGLPSSDNAFDFDLGIFKEGCKVFLKMAKFCGIKKIGSHGILSFLVIG